MHRSFLDEHFLLESETAQELYHNHAAVMPIYDFHCHLSAKDIAEDRQFDNLTQAWLAGDHYKWRAMRANGVDEKYCTGSASDEDKFKQWAATVPYTVRNPLYHWTHLELKRYFDIDDLLTPKTAGAIYKHCSDLLRKPEFSVRNLIRKMNVSVIGTTDDPLSDLRYHRRINEGDFTCMVVPTFRPDMAMAIEYPKQFNTWVNELSKITNMSITSYEDFIAAIRKRHDFFHANDCRTADHGIEAFYFDHYTPAEIEDIFCTVRNGSCFPEIGMRKFKTDVLLVLCRLNWEKRWVQQIHYGPLRNVNSRLFSRCGSDAGGDTMGNGTSAVTLAQFLDTLDAEGHLAKSIIYNNNPQDNALIATMIGGFQDGSIPGKMQFGSAWWFCDHKEGIEAQLNALSHNGLLSRFVGMVTDSRSFLSFIRHEYFRRILCNMIGKDVEAGLIPYDKEWLGTLITRICYTNAQEYFNLALSDVS